MQAFSFGPFDFDPTKRVFLDSKPAHTWDMRYRNENLGWHTLLDTATRDEIIEAFTDDRTKFEASARTQYAPDVVLLTEFDAEDTRLAFARDPGLTPGIVDERSRWWLRSNDLKYSLDVSLAKFAAIAAECLAPENHWICGLLPDSVLTTDTHAWRAPTAWEIRHIVGEGSFTRVTGAKAAELVGITPQNFRKYTARDGASTRQNMSYAVWHLLLHKLGVQRA